MQITISTPDGKPSWLKIAPRQGSELAGAAEITTDPSKKLEKILVKNGQVLHVKDANIDRDSHVRLEFDKPAEFKLGGKVYTWPEGYVYSKHCKGYNAVVAQKVVAATPFSAAGSSKLIVPCTYRSQVDNSADTGQGGGFRQCASTSAVMLLETAKGLEWLNRTTKGFAQPEDWYTTQLTKRGFDTTDPQAHVSMLNGLGVPVSFRYDCSISDMNKTLDKGLALMAGVNWKAGGHYVVFSGRDLVTGDYFWKDPYGLRAFDGDDPIDEYVTIGSGGDLVRLTMKKVQNVWLDLGDRAGWSLYPGDDVYGVNYQKPVVEIAQAAPTATPATPKIPDGCSRVTATQLTLLKSRPIASSELPPEEKNSFDLGEDIVGVASTAAGGHVMVTLADDSKIKGRNTWYLFSKHVRVETPGGTSPSTPGAKITDADYDRVAKMIGCETRALKTVVMVEAAGGGFLPSGRPKILFEAHWFGDFTGYKHNNSHPGISSKGWNPDLYEGGEKEWDRFEAAAKINRKFAIGSCSWGLPQIMGAYSWEMPGLGFKDEEDFYTRMCRSEGDQLEAMGRFIMLDSRLVSGIKNKNWPKFAEAYNGESYAVNQYDKKLADAYASLG